MTRRSPRALPGSLTGRKTECIFTGIGDNLTTAAISSDSKNPDLQSIDEDSFCPKDVVEALDDLGDSDDSDSSDHIQGRDVLPFDAEAEALTQVSSHVTQV